MGGGHFGPTELRLAMAAPRSAAGLTSEWRLVDGLRTHTRRSTDPGTGTPRVFATVSHSVRNPIERDLVRVTAPTLVVTGDRDPVVPAPWRDEATRLVPDANLLVVPGAAHNVVTTAPTQVADGIRRLLAPQPALSDR
ncbi:alpha/beta hydrolase [Micromonospora sp. NPDC048839]|uniref:alpha/beta fold hydrolase n=1 Tax=Micromonospora sp. NPDC048839 TaxID=3155641 RepID=UPI0033D78684